jgi:serine/threonine protein kinase
MGEVYRATDTNLGRQVAIKILPDAFAHDPERLARFDREAKTLAALNHPNIAQIYGLEKAEGIGALVMELIEGPTLADRIAAVAGQVIRQKCVISRAAAAARMREEDDGEHSDPFRWTPHLAREAAVADGIERLHTPLGDSESARDKWVVHL